MIYSEGQNGEFNLDFKVVIKTVEVIGLKIENKTGKNVK